MNNDGNYLYYKWEMSLLFSLRIVILCWQISDMNPEVNEVNRKMLKFLIKNRISVHFQPMVLWHSLMTVYPSCLFFFFSLSVNDMSMGSVKRMCCLCSQKEMCLHTMCFQQMWNADDQTHPEANHLVNKLLSSHQELWLNNCVWPLYVTEGEMAGLYEANQSTAYPVEAIVQAAVTFKSYQKLDWHQDYCIKVGNWQIIDWCCGSLKHNLNNMYKNITYITFYNFKWEQCHYYVTILCHYIYILVFFLVLSTDNVKSLFLSSN